MNKQFSDYIANYLKLEFGRNGISDATRGEIYHAVSRAAAAIARDGAEDASGGKRACYFSAEFLIGRLIFDNLNNLGLLDDARELLGENGADISDFEEIEDAALGNGGLGRLAACYLDSAATHGIPLDGYGIRYRYGLFKQHFEDGRQKETADAWQIFGDPWSYRRDDESVTVQFSDGAVRAVPYDMPVIGYGGKCINRLRLWQSEPLCEFDFDKFSSEGMASATSERIKAEAISAVLYPNEKTLEGYTLRLKQQYFFTSASLRDIVRRYKAAHGCDFSHLADSFAIQLNDTHPTVAIPELMRILVDEEGLGFEEAFAIVQDVFAYTNHTVLPEALEKWDAKFFYNVIPQVYDFIIMIDRRLQAELRSKGFSDADASKFRIIEGGNIHMARLAIYATHSTNGVAQLHTDILKHDLLAHWYKLYPERFNNKTNGITQRRWLYLCNKGLSSFITDRIGDGWITDLPQLEGLTEYADDEGSLREFIRIKRENKERLARFVAKNDGVKLNSSFVFDIQAKRLHEYKRQLLNAFSILDIYFGIKSGRITDFTPTAFIFGAKAAAGYREAKAIIKYINDIAALINGDSEVNDLMQVVFIQNYNVSSAEYIIPAADISEQISTAGREASGTGNMKFMLSGAVTLGTYDGANVEIVECAGEENNYIFGARVEEIEAITDSYDPKALYDREPRIRAVVDTLTDGTFGDNDDYRMLRDLLFEREPWHRPDHYFILHDFLSYCDAKMQALSDYRDELSFAKKCLLNTAHAGKFSSDRSVKEYAKEIWKL